MRYDLTTKQGRTALAAQIVADVDAFCAVAYDDGPRSHLGASVIGHPCKFYLWASFRWAHEERFDGRMRRLFQRGHWEEPHWHEWFRGNGWTVQEYVPQYLQHHPESDSFQFTDTDEPLSSAHSVVAETDPEFRIMSAIANAKGVKQKQIRIEFSEGHGGGSLDAECSHSLYTDNEVFLGEFKTYKDSRFKELVKSGMQKSEPKYWAQMCVYGVKRRIKYAIFCAINKDNDKICIEVKELDWTYGQQMIDKAEEIILSKTPPPRISDNPAWSDCKMCGKYAVCHGGEKVDVNCRSCRHAEVRTGGQWFCTRWDDFIPKDFIPKGCDEHFPIFGPK